MNYLKFSLLVFPFGLALAVKAYASILPENINQKNFTLQSIPTQDESKVSVEAPKNQEGNKAYSIKNIKIYGGTAFPIEEISNILKPLLNSKTTSQEISDHLNQINTLYKKGGYTLSYAYVPITPLDSGVLEVYLIEGHIAQLDIQSDNPEVKKLLTNIASGLISKGTPLRQSSFERYATIIKSIPGIQTQITVPIPESISGATTLKIVAQEDKPASFNAGLGYQNNAPIVSANSTIYRLLNSHDKLSLNALLSLDKGKEKFASANYETVLTGNGSKVSLGYLYYKSEASSGLPVAAANSTFINLNYNQNQKTNQAFIQYSYPLLLSYRMKVHVLGRLDYISESNKIDYFYQGVFLQSQESQFKIPSISAGLSIAKAEEDYNFSADFLIKHGVDGLGAEIKNSSGSLGFTSYDLTLKNLYQLNEHFYLNSSGRVFYSSDTLPYPVKVNFGGSNFGRAYPQGTIVGDKGVGASTQLEYKKNISNTYVKSITPFVGFDYAETASNSAVANQPILRSAVLGASVTNNENYNLTLSYGHALNQVVLNGEKIKGQFNLTYALRF